jgi:hypothetical protein
MHARLVKIQERSRYLPVAPQVQVLTVQTENCARESQSRCREDMQAAVEAKCLVQVRRQYIHACTLREETLERQESAVNVCMDIFTQPTHTYTHPPTDVYWRIQSREPRLHQSAFLMYEPRFETSP